MEGLLALPFRVRATIAAVIATASVLAISAAVTASHRDTTEVRTAGSGHRAGPTRPSGTAHPSATVLAPTPRATAAAITPPATPLVRTAPPATVATAVGCPSVPAGSPGGTISANFATALAFAPDGRLFYAERSGTVRVVLAGVPRVFATVPTVTTEVGGGYSERGLLGLVVSPSYAADHHVFALYSAADRTHQVVVRWTDCGGTGADLTRLITLPSGADCCHKGGRLAFGPDGKLYVTVGDEHNAMAAQDTSDLRGKILRYNADGTVPTDNPFGGGNPVWAYGLRNPFGIAFSPSGQMMVTSNGPSGEIPGIPETGYDLVISPSRGTGSQWPLCYGFSHPVPPNTSCNGQPGPDWSSESDVAGKDTVVPTGATFVDGSGPSGLAGHFVFCTDQRGMRVLRGGGGTAAVSAGPGACRLDVKESPGHAVYYSDEGHIYRQS